MQESSNKKSDLLNLGLGHLPQLSSQSFQCYLPVVELAAMFLRQPMPSAVHIAALALNPQKAQLFVAVEAPLLVLLLPPRREHWYFLEEVRFPAGGRDLGPRSGDWRQRRHFFLLAVMGGTG